MERYESLGLVGEGSYGTVLKCRHRDSGRLVAIKKFVDSDDDKAVKKIALREIKLLRQLHHDNLVNLLEVWKRRRRWYLVFEFVERTLLDDLEQNPSGLDLNTSRQYLYQLLRATAFCHEQHVIHRDIKPENILISQGGVVKLCDFGFARTMTSPADGGVYTDYVATRWYRAPELLVGDTKYGKPVDVWAVGCLLIEMLTGQPLFPGDSDLDQIYHIIRCFGNLTSHHQELFYRNPVFSGVRLPECSSRVPLEQRFPAITTTALDLAQSCLQMDPERRAQCSELLEHSLFTQDSFHIRVLEELNAKIQKDHRENSTFPKIGKTGKREKDEGDDKNPRGKDKKQAEDLDGKVRKEKEKKEKEGGEEKVAKTKVKQPLKLPKSTYNYSETVTSNKQSKTFGANVVDNGAKTAMPMKSKPGKAPGAELKKEPEITKPTKTYTSESLEPSRTATDLKKTNTTVAKPKHGKVACSRDGPLKNIDTKDRESTGEHSSCSDYMSVTDKSVMETRGSSKSEFSQDLRNNSNTRVLKLSESSNSDHQIKSLSQRASLKSTLDPTDTNLTQRMGKSSSAEHPEGTTVSSMTFNGSQEQTVETSSKDHIQVSTTIIPSDKPCKRTTTLEHQTNCSNVDSEQRRTSEYPKVLPSNPKPSKTAAISGPRMTKHNMSLSNSPSKTLTSDLSQQFSKTFTEANPPHSTTTLPKGILQGVSSSHIKPANNTTPVPNKPPTGLPTDMEVTELFMTTENQQDSCNASNKDTKDDQGCLNMSPVTPTKYSEISKASGRDYKESPESVHQQSTSTTKSRTTSTSMPSEILKTKMSVGTATLKTLKASDKENREELALFVSISATTKSSVSSNTDQRKSCSEAEANRKALKPPHQKPLMGEPKTKFGSFSSYTKSTAAVKPRRSTDAQRKRDNQEKNNSTNISTDSFGLRANPDHRASTRCSVSHNMDTKEFDFSVPQPSPPPPPPPPSSTPLLLPPSSTPLIPSFSIISTTSPGVSDQPTLGTSFHPGTHSLRCVDKPRHHGSIYSRLAQQSSHLPAQVSEKSMINERAFLSDRCNRGNSDGFAVTKRKSDVHFPDLRSPVLPELRGREGKHTKGTSRDQRKDKQLESTNPPSEPQRHGHNSTDSHSP